eukprot:1808013-Rhodomonas_salina.2
MPAHARSVLHSASYHTLVSTAQSIIPYTSSVPQSAWYHSLAQYRTARSTSSVPHTARYARRR